MNLLSRFSTFALLFIFLSAVALGQQEKEPARSIRVHGTGKIKAVPDQLRLSIQVNVPRAETAVEALSRNNQLTAQVMAMLKRFGVAETDLQTTRVSVNPVYDYSKQNTSPAIVGYSAQNEVVVVIRRMEDAGKILDQAVKNGATGFGPLLYDSSRRAELEREAFKNAADDARVKAELLTKQLGATLGRVMTINELGVSSPSPVVPMMQMRMAAAEVPVSPGEMEIQANVEVVFELK